MKDIAAPRLDIRDLRVALAVAEAGTTAKAAALLHLTQPAVSRALIAAEDKLGIRLFDRTSRGLVPTTAGACLLAGAARMLVELTDLEHRVRAPVAPPARLRLVCECYTAYHWIPTALAGMRELVPDLAIALAVEHTGDPIAALADGKVDIALVTTAAVPRPLPSRALFADELVFVMASTHPLARKKAVSAADIRATLLLTSPTPPGEVQWFMTSVFGRARPRLRFQLLPLTEAIIELARAGMGIAVLSEWIASPHLDRGDLVVRRFARAPLRRPWRLAWRPEVTAIADRLWSALTAVVPHARLVA